MNATFEPFPKIARLSRDMTVLEKLDGSNAQVYITPETSDPEMLPDIPWLGTGENNIHIAAGSRNRWLSIENDNYGFAKWVQANIEELLKLGPGRHFGEWWGLGIQRGYGLQEKRFSLFNTARWVPAEFAVGERFAESKQEVPPACCHVVPVLYRGVFCTETIEHTLHKLARNGSLAARGFMQPEGIVIYHTASKTLFKKTFNDDLKGNLPE